MKCNQQHQLSLTSVTPIIYCKLKHKAILACTNPDCQIYPFLCSIEDCQCQKDHYQCPVTLVNNLSRALRKKIINSKPIQDKISQFFEQIIDKISTYRDKILQNFKQNLSSYFGLQDFQANFLKAFDEGKTQTLKGNNFWQIQINLKNTSKVSLGIQKISHRISNILKEFDGQVDIFAKNLSEKIKNMQNVILCDSKIIKSNEELDKLQSFFQNKRIKSLQLLYRASENAFQSTIFHEKCDNIKNTLVICHTEFNKIIGGFTTLPWKNINQWQIDNMFQTFVFSLTNKHKFTCKNTHNRIYGSSTYGPYFSNHGDFAILNKANQNPCFANVNCSFINQNYQKNDPNSYRLFSGSQTANFKLKQWEVFKIQFEQ